MQGFGLTQPLLVWLALQSTGNEYAALGFALHRNRVVTAPEGARTPTSPASEVGAGETAIAVLSREELTWGIMASCTLTWR